MSPASDVEWCGARKGRVATSARSRFSNPAILWIFDVSIGRQNQPLNLPKLMEALESLINRNGISDPQQLLPLLKDLSGDERVPLIARNHALRLIKKIEKK